VAHAHERAARARGRDLKAVARQRDRARDSLEQRRGVTHLEHAPVLVVPHLAQVGQATFDQPCLVARGVVQRHVGQRDVADCELVQPGAVASAVERVIVEKGVVATVELAFPAARERHRARDVGRLPVVLRERDLDPERAAPAFEEAQQRLVVAGAKRGVAAGTHDVADGRVQRPVRQRQRDQGDYGRVATAGQRADHERPRQQRAEARGVAAQRVGQREGGDQHQRVQPGADAQRALTRGQQRRDERQAGERGPEGGGHERLAAALGEQGRQRRRGAERGEHEGCRARAALARRCAGQTPGDDGQRQEQPRDGAGERRRGGERDGEQRAP